MPRVDKTNSSTATMMEQFGGPAPSLDNATLVDNRNEGMDQTADSAPTEKGTRAFVPPVQDSTAGQEFRKPITYRPAKATWDKGRGRYCYGRTIEELERIEREEAREEENPAKSQAEDVSGEKWECRMM